MNLTVFKNAELIPIVRDGLLPGYDLWVEDGIITRLTPTGRNLPEGVRLVDCTGKYILPGLIDSHIHLVPGCENDLKVLVAFGVTSVRNMWGNQPVDLETPGVDARCLREDLAAGRVVGPTLVNTSRILDGTPTVQVCSRSLNTVNDAMLFIKEALREGATQLKVYKNLLPEVLDALHELGAEHGLRIVGHKPDAVLAEDFFSKAYSVEHTFTFALADVSALQRSNCYFVPTLVMENNIDLLVSGEGAILASQAQVYDKFISPAIAKVWKDVQAEEMRPRLEEFADFQQTRLKVEKYVAQGGIPAAGTDFPNPFCYPGTSLHDEMVLLHECGLTNQQTLFAATLQSARVLEIEDRKGTLEIGKDADLLVLTSNPLVDIHNTLSIETVVLRGRQFDRPALDGLLVDAAQAVRIARDGQECSK